MICANKDEKIDTRFGRFNGLQMQVVIGGIAPEGTEEEGWIEEFINWMKRPELRERFVYVPNADTIVLKMQAIGADICINCPMPEKEACGTSDQRTARNGGINIATRSGGPLEYIEDGKSGMLVGPYINDIEFYDKAPRDILFKLKELSEMYYNQSDSDNRWLEMKYQSYLASSKVTAAAMEQKYTELYAKTLNMKNMLSDDSSEPSYDTANNRSQLESLLQETVSNLPYCDSLLENWILISGSSSFDYQYDNRVYEWKKEARHLLPEPDAEREMLDFCKVFMKSNLTLDINSIHSGSVNRDSISKNSRLDASLLLLWSINRYIESTKDFDFLNALTNSVFFQKQTTIIKYMLKEIIETNRRETIPKETSRENKATDNEPLYASLNSSIG